MLQQRRLRPRQQCFIKDYSRRHLDLSNNLLKICFPIFGEIFMIGRASCVFIFTIWTKLAISFNNSIRMNKRTVFFLTINSMFANVSFLFLFPLRVQIQAIVIFTFHPKFAIHSLRMVELTAFLCALLPICTLLWCFFSNRLILVFMDELAVWVFAVFAMATKLSLLIRLVFSRLALECRLFCVELILVLNVLRISD